MNPTHARRLAVLFAAFMIQPVMAQSGWDPTDTDNDGLPDAWEMAYFNNLASNGTTDNDGDSVPNSLEFSSGRNPTLGETTAGIPDWHAVPGALRFERWNGVQGTTLSSLYLSPAFQLSTPSTAGFYTSAEAPQNQGDNFGLRMVGTLKAPVSGDYRFYIAGDDQAQLYLGETASPFSKRPVCSVNSWTNFRAWNASGPQASALIPLIAGQDYYFEAWMKEGGGGDHLSVGWTRPGTNGVEPVPGRLPDGTVVLTSYAPDLADADGDGLPDAWETANGLNPNSRNDHAFKDSDGDGFTNLVEYQTGGNPLGRGGNVGFCEWQTFWIGPNNLKLSALTSSSLFAQVPGNAGYFAAPEADRNAGNNFGRRIRGVVTIPTAGSYRFYISGDDSCALWINPNGVSRFGKTQVAFSHTATSFRSFAEKPTQKSAEYSFHAGDKVYFEALYVEGSGADHCSVGWTGPGYGIPAVIPSAQISTCADEIRVVDGMNNDQDNDSLPDDWEVAQSLSVTNGNTATAMLHGEYGDPDNDGLTNFQEWQNGTNPFTVNGVQGMWTHELYADIGGSRIVDLIGTNGLLRAPDLVRLSATTETFRNYANNYGQRFRATLKAPVTGPYTFWISGDDGAELWISTDDRKFFKRRVAFIDDLNATYSYSSFRNWGKTPGQRSAPITMVAGQSYYIEVLHKEAGEDDHVSVAWSFQAATPADGYVPVVATPALLFPGIQLANVTAAAGTLNGAGIGPYDATMHHFTNDRSIATFQLQMHAGPFTKAVKVELTQTPEGVAARQIYARYKAGEFLGENFDTLGGTGTQTMGAGGYGVDGLALLNASGTLASTRMVLPSTVLTSFVRDAQDLDDDCLNDEWEDNHRLSSTDNGSVNSANGEYGDPDNDSLVNRVEWLLGTDPMNPDTDSDGYADGQEVYFLGTDPTVAEFSTPSVIGEIAVDGQTGASATWVPTADGGMLSMENRGWIDYRIDVDEGKSGYYAFEIRGRARGSAIQTREDFPLDVYIDSRKVASTVLTSLNGKSGLAAGLAGWLTEGSHTLRIWNRNLLARRALQLDSLRIVMPSGEPYSYSNGLPGWIYDFLATRNTVTATGLGSFVSPCCVEGTSRDWVATGISLAGGPTAPVRKGIDNRWFADVALDALTTTRSVIHFENGIMEQDLEIEWLPFNIAADSHLIVRRDDSLKLTAFAPGGVADSSPVTINIDGQNVATVPANEPFIYRFTTTGTHKLVATYSGNPPVTSTIETIAADMGPAFPIYLNRSRVWTPPVLAPGLPVESDSSLYLAAQAPVSGRQSFTADATRLGTNTVLARTGTGGPVLAAGEVTGILLSHSSNYELPVIYTYPNGDRIVELTIFATDLPPDGFIRLEIWLGGRIFTDITTSKILRAEDFDENGIAKVRMILSSGIGTTCHRTYLHDAAGNLVGQM